MTYTLTFVAANNNLNVEKINFIAPDDSEVSWLSKNKAAEIQIKDSVSIEQVEKYREQLDEHKIDIFCTPSENRRKKLFMADMDATIVTTETLDELADEAGIKPQIAEITERAMHGELDFHDALRERVRLIKDLPEEALKRTLDNTIISTGADILLKTLKSHGVFTGLVSGGFTYYTSAISNQLGFDINHGNQLDIQNAKLTGEVIDPILDKDSKLAFLNQYVQQQNIALSDSVAIGDGANDLPMLTNAGLGIGYQPKPLLREQILNCIIHTDLISVLYMQGYRDTEISL
ncbi:MAG: phosphoserine phosphatase SerB [Pseudomonadota bacterium]